MTRPALADVLAVMTTESDPAWWRGIVRLYSLRFDGAVVLGAKSDRVAYDVGRLRHATPAGALEALVTAELLPAHWSDPARAPRWWCERCAGVGRVTLRSIDGSGDLGSYAVMPDARGDLRCDAFDVSGAPPCGAPPSLLALVAVAALGVDALARAEAIVAETWRARVVWRVMTREALRKHHDRRRRNTFIGNEEMLLAFASAIAGGLRECPLDEGFLAQRWPALLALHDLGLHLLAVDDGRVTLGVEALP